MEGELSRGGPPAWGFGGGLTTPHCKIKKKKYYKIVHRASN